MEYRGWMMRNTIIKLRQVIVSAEELHSKVQNAGDGNTATNWIRFPRWNCIN